MAYMESERAITDRLVERVRRLDSETLFTFLGQYADSRSSPQQFNVTLQYNPNHVNFATRLYTEALIGCNVEEHDIILRELFPNRERVYETTRELLEELYQS